MHGNTSRFDSSGSGRPYLLVVEDHPVGQRLAVDLLEAAGYRVKIAGRGVEALRWLQQESYAAILMDVELPDIDGCEVTRRFRAEEVRIGAAAAGRRTPIFATSAHVEEAERQRCLDAGMDGYLGKPLCAETLRARLGELTAPPVPAKPPFTAPVPVHSESGHSGAPAADGLDGLVAEELRQAIEVLRGAIAKGDAILVERTAHALRGVLLMLGAKRPATAAGLLERVGASGNLTASPRALIKLEQTLRQVWRPSQETACAPVVEDIHAY